MRRAPNSLPRVEEVLGKHVGQPTFAKPPSDALLEAVRDGDREASGSRPETPNTDAQLAPLGDGSS